MVADMVPRSVTAPQPAVSLLEPSDVIMSGVGWQLWCLDPSGTCRGKLMEALRLDDGDGAGLVNATLPSVQLAFRPDMTAPGSWWLNDRMILALCGERPQRRCNFDLCVCCAVAEDDQPHSLWEPMAGQPEGRDAARSTGAATTAPRRNAPADVLTSSSSRCPTLPSRIQRLHRELHELQHPPAGSCGVHATSTTSRGAATADGGETPRRLLLFLYAEESRVHGFAVMFQLLAAALAFARASNRTLVEVASSPSLAPGGGDTWLRAPHAECGDQKFGCYFQPLSSCEFQPQYVKHVKDVPLLDLHGFETVRTLCSHRYRRLLSQLTVALYLCT